ELRWVDTGGIGARDSGELGRELVAEPLDPARNLHEIAPLEPAGHVVGVAEDPGGNGAAAVAQLDREIRRSGARRHPILAGAGEYALDRAPRSQPGYRDAFLRRSGHAF